MCECIRQHVRQTSLKRVILQSKVLRPTFPLSCVLVSMTIVLEFSSQTIRQKSDTVSRMGPVDEVEGRGRWGREKGGGEGRGEDRGEGGGGGEGG